MHEAFTAFDPLKKNNNLVLRDHYGLQIVELVLRHCLLSPSLLG